MLLIDTQGRKITKARAKRLITEWMFGQLDEIAAGESISLYYDAWVMSGFNGVEYTLGDLLSMIRA